MKARFTCHTLRAALLGLVLGASLLANEPALAQLGDRSPVEALQTELERTALILERLIPQVAESDHPRAGELIKKAVYLQKQARSLFERGRAFGFQEGQPRRILFLTRTARELALRAERVLREQATLQERARSRIERTRQLLERIGDHEGELRSDSHRRILEEARRQLDAAEAHFRDREFEVALKLAEGAESLLRTLVRQVGADVRPERLRHELERTRQLIERARERADELDTGGRKRLERAADLQARAEEAFGLERFGRARELTTRARRLLRSLLDQMGGNVGPEDVQRALERLDTGLAELREAAGGDLDERVVQILERIATARERAEAAAKEGHYQEALSRLRAAMGLLGRARDLQRDSNR